MCELKQSGNGPCRRPVKGSKSSVMDKLRNTIVKIYQIYSAKNTQTSEHFSGKSCIVPITPNGYPLRSQNAFLVKNVSRSEEATL